MPEDAADGPDTRVGEAGIVREIFESMPIMLVGMTGPELRLVAANAAYRRSYGRDRLVGRTVAEVFPEMAGQLAYEMADRVYATGAAQTGEGWRIQVEREPGSGRLEDLYVDFTLAPRPGPDGAVAGINFIGVDVTARVLEQQRARAETAAAIRRYERARDVITALQRQLLPPGLPVLPAVRIAGSYLPAGAGEAAGGDWFDAVPLAGGRVALVVGDVAGHGVAASAAMGQLRAVLQDRLDESGDLPAAFAAADRMAGRVPGTHAATVCVVLLDPADGTLTWCSAGHPPPLVAGPGGARYLPPAGSGPLGTGASYAPATDRLGLGEVVLLYSDGIIERPGRTPAAATVELARVAADAVAGRGLTDTGLSAVDRACAHTVELLVRQTGHADDITLLAAQRINPAPWLRLEEPGGDPAIHSACAAITRWLAGLGASESDVTALAHAVVELVTNAVEHAHPDTAGGSVTVTASLGDDGRARITVADDGRWLHRERPAGEEFRRDHGLGLAMTRGLVDRLDIEPGERGTTATVHHRLSRPARLLTAGPAASAEPGPAAAGAGPLALTIEEPDADGIRVAIYGPLEPAAAERLGGELDRLTLGGTHQLIVDLTGVTHLASAAVAVLFRTAGLRLYAPAGSVAQQVMSVVGLPHTTTDPGSADDR